MVVNQKLDEFLLLLNERGCVVGFSQKISVCLRASLVAALWGVVSLSTHAQGIADMFDAKTQNILSSAVGAWAAPQGNTGKAALSAGQSAALDKLGTLTPNANGPTSNYIYRYNPKVSENVRNGLAKSFVKRLGNMSEKEMADDLKEMNLAESTSEVLESKGYAKHSLATAVAYWMLVNMEIVYGTQFNDTQNAATVRQVEQQMAANPDIGQLEDAAKQYIAENLIWMAAFQAVGYQNAREGRPGASDMQTLVQGARGSLEIFQINPDDFRMTAEGLVAR